MQQGSVGTAVAFLLQGHVALRGWKLGISINFNQQQYVL
jgi:hypothetical protein